MAVPAIVVGAAFCAHAKAEAAAPLAARIGYVDMEEALNRVSDGVKAKKQLKLEFKEKQQRLDILQKKVASMRDELDRERLTLPPDVLKTKERTYRQQLMEVQQRFADFQREMAGREARLTEEIIGRLRGIVRRIGDDEGFALILEKSQEVVLYAPHADDITDRVIKLYDGSSRGKRRR